MIQQLKNIFVPYNVAKLAYEKQFGEWCACLVSEKRGHTPNFSDIKVNGYIETHFGLEFEIRPINGHYYCPTHLQLILWLKNTHNIDVTMGHNGLWSVLDSQGTLIYQNDECFFEINQALDLGLKLVENHGK